jgi:hypothetical protein
VANAGTFAKLEAKASRGSPAVAGARVVSLHHLLALKYHAVKHAHAGRIVKDADDVIRLVLANRLDVKKPEFRELVLKHGIRICMKKSKKSAARTEAAELQLPDWSGMDDSSGRISVDAAFRFCEEYRILFPQLADPKTVFERRKCDAEFVLD